MSDKNMLHNIVYSEMSKIEDENMEKIDLVIYTKKVFIENYDTIKQVYSRNPDSDEKLFLKVKFCIEQIIDITKPGRYLSKQPDVNPMELGMLSKWVNWESDNIKNENFAILNDNGKKIVDEWNKYRNRIEIMMGLHRYHTKLYFS